MESTSITPLAQERAGYTNWGLHWPAALGAPRPRRGGLEKGLQAAPPPPEAFQFSPSPEWQGVQHCQCGTGQQQLPQPAWAISAWRGLTLDREWGTNTYPQYLTGPKSGPKSGDTIFMPLWHGYGDTIELPSSALCHLHAPLTSLGNALGGSPKEHLVKCMQTDPRHLPPPPPWPATLRLHCSEQAM